MRASGVVDSAGGLLPFGHLCWAYSERADFLLRARQYAADGLAAGQWVEYVGPGDAGALRGELADVPELDAAARAGRIAVMPIADFYVHDGAVVDPVRSVAARVAAVERALADGFTGFRAVVDCTDVVRSARQVAAFAVFEYLIDKRMCVAPVSALCAYDRSALGEAAVAELACLHPFVNDGCSAFRMYAERDAEFALAGAVSGPDVQLFTRAFERAVSLSVDPDLVIDGRRLDHMDHAGLHALDRIADARGRPTVLRGSVQAARLARHLPLTRLRVEAPAAAADPDVDADAGSVSAQTEFALTIRRVSRAFSHYRTVAGRAVYGVGPSDGATLAELYFAGPLTPGELAKRSHLTTPTMTEVLDRLERAGHTHRAPHPTDRRKVVISLTPGAVDTIEREAPQFLGLLAPVLDELDGPTLGTLLRVLGRVAEVLEDETLAVCSDARSAARS